MRARLKRYLTEIKGSTKGIEYYWSLTRREIMRKSLAIKMFVAVFALPYMALADTDDGASGDRWDGHGVQMRRGVSMMISLRQAELSILTLKS